MKAYVIMSDIRGEIRTLSVHANYDMALTEFKKLEQTHLNSNTKVYIHCIDTDTSNYEEVLTT